MSVMEVGKRGGEPGSVVLGEMNCDMAVALNTSLCTLFLISL